VVDFAGVPGFKHPHHCITEPKQVWLKIENLSADHRSRSWFGRVQILRAEGNQVLGIFPNHLNCLLKIKSRSFFSPRAGQVILTCKIEICLAGHYGGVQKACCPALCPGSCRSRLKIFFRD